MNHQIDIIRFQEPVPYAEALRLQIARRDAVEQNLQSNALFLLEHPPVITLGRNTHPKHILHSPEELARIGVDIQEAGRGGDVTYHGPGQLVAYPILDLQRWKPSISWYLRSLEEVIIRLLGEYGIEGKRMEGFTGVWVDGAKVAAVGVGIHHWVTFHGTALNVAPDMTHFGLIVPCGISDKPVTSLTQLLGFVPPMCEVSDRFEAQFLSYFGPEFSPTPHVDR